VFSKLILVVQRIYWTLETVQEQNVASIGSTGNATFEASTNSSTAFQVENSSGSSLLTVNTSSSNVTVNANELITAGNSLTVTGSNAFPGSPTAGEIYYRTDLNELFVYENGQWQADTQAQTEIVTSAQYSSNYYRGNFVVPSGSTTAQTQINNAIAALPAVGGVVYLAEGTYTVSGSINIPSNVSLIGSGSGATIIMPSGSFSGNGLIVPSTSATNVQISNLGLNGNSTSVYGMYMITPGGSPPGYGADTSSGVQVMYVAETGGYYGIYMSGGGNNLITQSSFDSNTGGGIYSSGGEYNTISNNTDQNNGHSGYTYGYGIELYDGSHNKIEGNAFDWNNLSNYGMGLWMDDETEDVISGNDLSHNNWAGLYGLGSTTAAADNVITGNTADSSSDEGIDLETGSYDTYQGIPQKMMTIVELEVLAV